MELGSDPWKLRVATLNRVAWLCTYIIGVP